MLKDQIIDENQFLFENEIERKDCIETVQDFDKIETGLDDGKIDAEIELDEKIEKGI